jgi:hypothetical protein
VQNRPRNRTLCKSTFSVVVVNVVVVAVIAVVVDVAVVAVVDTVVVVAVIDVVVVVKCLRCQFSISFQIKIVAIPNTELKTLGRILQSS